MQIAGIKYGGNSRSITGEKGGQLQECESCRDVYTGSVQLQAGCFFDFPLCDVMEGARAPHVEASACVLLALLSS